jgi:hypothetical protein
MSHGIEPTQMDEWRRKNRTRIFVEERLLDMRDISVLFFRGLKSGIDVAESVAKVSLTKQVLLCSLALGVLAFLLLY